MDQSGICNYSKTQAKGANQAGCEEPADMLVWNLASDPAGVIGLCDEHGEEAFEVLSHQGENGVTTYHRDECDEAPEESDWVFIYVDGPVHDKQHRLCSQCLGAVISA